MFLGADSTRWKGRLYLLLTHLSYSTMITFAKLTPSTPPIIPDMSPFKITYFRGVLGTALAVLLLRKTGVPIYPESKRVYDNYLNILVSLGVAACALYVTAHFLSVSATNIMYALQSPVLPILGFFVLGQKLNPRVLGVLGVMVLGAILVIKPELLHLGGEEEGGSQTPPAEEGRADKEAGFAQAGRSSFK